MSSSESPPFSIPGYERPRILVVDDDDALRRSAVAVLSDDGFEVREAASGLHALEICERFSPDVVLLDVTMPEMNGYETCVALRERPGGADQLILMTTGLDDPESIEHAYDAGATDFIAKPINFQILRHRMRYLVRARKDRQLAEERVQRMAFYDELTGLPNRAFLKRHLPYVIEQARRGERAGAVLSLDLDGFKRVNDTLGHAAGDRLLREVGGRLESCLRGGDCVTRGELTENDAIARFGGDEFVVVLSDLESMEDAAQVSHRIIETLSRPVALGGQDFHVNCSIGIAPFPSGEDDPEVLLRNADAAMYDAKRNGGSRFQFYCSDMSRRTREALELENRLRRALEREEFELHYQPKIESKTGRVVGVEALLRWRSPERGLVPPMDFIPLAEKTGLIIPIGAWVLRRACRELKSWEGQGLPAISMAVNISTRQFRDRDVSQLVRAALAETGVVPKSLELEITEGSLMEDTRYAASVLNELRQIGVRVAIDDFGTGYSSLGYLRVLPVDMLKIDRSFVRDVTENQDSAAIAAAILAMSHSLRLEAVAEGVETRAQLDFLVQHGCPLVQGFLYSRPLPGPEFVAWLRAREAAPPSADAQERRAERSLALPVGF
ncbi:MAG TPA: EAL domain-containing protein [Polyangiaceae bacterium]